jgi:hypothetical protein
MVFAFPYRIGSSRNLALILLVDKTRVRLMIEVNMPTAME